MKNKPTLLFIFYLLFSTQLFSQNPDKRLAISIFGGTAVLQGDGASVNLAGAGGLGLKYSLANNFAIRAQGFGGQMSVQKSSYTSINTFYEGNIEALLNIVNFKKQSTGRNIAQLYVGVGVGFVLGNLKYSKGSGSDLKSISSLVVPIGGGIRVYVTPLIDVGVEYFLRGTFTDNLDGGTPSNGTGTGSLTGSEGQSNDFYNLPQAFITFNLGKNPKARCLEWTEQTEKLYEELIKAKQDAQQQIDALKKQNDQLMNIMGKDLQEQMKNNQRRADSAMVAIKESMKNDSDSDGVSNIFDKEPTSPIGAIVDGGGRTLDVDKDGVPDYLDKCPTVPGKVSSNGCPLQPTKAQLATLTDGIKNLQFETGKAIIKSTSFPALDNLAQMLVENSSFNFKIEGHTDNVGDPNANMALSLQRADAVKSYLVNKGVDELRVTARGFGDTKPVVSNDTAAGKAKNRRVDMTIE